MLIRGQQPGIINRGLIENPIDMTTCIFISFTKVMGSDETVHGLLSVNFLFQNLPVAFSQARSLNNVLCSYRAFSIQ